MKTDFQDLLVKTSRTFALSIPYLPEPVRLQVTLAYLIFRIADTFEDAATWPQQQRIDALDAFGRLLQTPRPDEAERLAQHWRAEVPIDHDGYQELIENVPAVLEAYFGLDSTARQTICEHALRTIQGMGEYVARTDADGELVLKDLDDLQQYCYIVAGIVGEMLTELFLAAAPDLKRAEALRARSRGFGEALQLVNILKDASFDATEGRSYLPPDLDRDTVFGVARDDLQASAEYIDILQEDGAPQGIVAFNGVQVLLAFSALQRVETKGPGAKISRFEVFQLIRRMEKALKRNEPVTALCPV